MTNESKRGRRAFEPTQQQRELVQQLVAFGTPQEHICLLIKKEDGSPISKPTLIRHFRSELNQGAMVANVKVAQNLFRMATGDGKGAVTAAIFWLKTRAGWKETTTVELGGAVGVGLTKVDKPTKAIIQKHIKDLNNEY